MPWFIKTETFRVPHAEVRPHLEAHRAWVVQQRARGVRLSSGYLVDGEGRPGGGGLLLLQAEDYASAAALVRKDPIVARGCVDWQPQGRRPPVGDPALGHGA